MSGTNYTRTPNLQLYKPTYRADGEAWGDHINWNADTLDAAVGPPGSVINVKSYGAKGDGTTDDTAAVQAAANAIPATGGTLYLPRGTYSVSGTLLVKSLTRVAGDGWGTVLAANASWPTGALLQLILNQNYAATSITDHDIIVENLTLDYTNLPSGLVGLPVYGAIHAVSCRMARNVQVRNCKFIAGPLGNDATAMVACDTTLIEDCVSYGTINGSYDHFWNPQNAKVVNCYASGPVPYVYFNPEPSTGAGTFAANNFLMTGCTIINTGSSQGPCQLEPLATGNTVANVTVVGNTFSHTAVMTRGATTGVVIADNTFINMTDGNCILAMPVFGGTPDGVVISGNVLINPASSSGAAPITAPIDGAVVTGNKITGSALGSTYGIDTSTNSPVVIGNSIANGQQNTAFATAGTGRVAARNGQGFAWKDNGGSLITFDIATDNHWLWYGTNASGGQRLMMDMYQRSASSAMNWSVPMTFAAGLGAWGNAAPASKPTVSGAKGGNAALASLLTALANYGLITDSST